MNNFKNISYVYISFQKYLIMIAPDCLMWFRFPTRHFIRLFLTGFRESSLIEIKEQEDLCCCLRCLMMNLNLSFHDLLVIGWLSLVWLSGDEYLFLQVLVLRLDDQHREI